MRNLILVIALLAGSNLLASSLFGLGDGEALYYCYSQNLSLSYLDHPPLIGWLIFLSTSLFGANVLAVRLVSIAMMILSAVFTYLLTRDMFGSRAAAWSPLLLLATPIFSVGLIAAAPDAPLAAIWPLFAWQLYRALVDKGDTGWTRFGRPTMLGLLIGLAFLAKYTGVCLVATAVIVLGSRSGRVWLKRPGVWIGALVAAATVLPVVVWNLQNEWAGVFHRLVWTQAGAGFSLRNVGALIGGQLLYVGPIVLPLLVWSIFYLLKKQDNRVPGWVLLAASLPVFGVTYPLVLWSDVAEPHWPGVGYMPLFAAAAGLVVDRARATSVAKVAVGFGCVVVVALHLAVGTPLLPVLLPEESYRPEYDLGNELRGWPEVAETIRAIDNDGMPVVSGFYTQCSQLTFALNRPGDPEVRCVSPEIDDFDMWHGTFVLPPKGAIFVTDNRFDHNPEELVSGARIRGSPLVVEITRGGRWVRRFKIYTLIPSTM
jgi:hypothetical protein